MAESVTSGPARGGAQETVLTDVHEPFCPTCGVTAGCAAHGHQMPTEADVPLPLRRELLACATAKGISYYWLTAIYRQGRSDLARDVDPVLDAAWQDIQDWCKTARGLRERSKAPKGPDYDPACPSAAGIEASERVLQKISAATRAEAAPAPPAEPPQGWQAVFQAWFARICQDDENPDGLWKLCHNYREAFSAGWAAALPPPPVAPEASRPEASAEVMARLEKVAHEIVWEEGPCEHWWVDNHSCGSYGCCGGGKEIDRKALERAIVERVSAALKGEGA